MERHSLLKWGILTGVLLAALLVGGACQKEKTGPPPADSSLQEGSARSTPTGGTPLPVLACVAEEQAGAVALQHLSTSRNLPLADLSIYGVKEANQLPLTGLRFREVFIVTSTPPEKYLVWVDCDGQVVPDREAASAAERKAAAEKYGKLEPTLYDHLQTLGPNDVVDIFIWARVPPGAEEAVEQQIREKYPQVRFAPGTLQPLDPADTDFFIEVIQPEGRRLQEQVFLAAQTPVAEWIRSQGFWADAPGGSAPFVPARVPKWFIVELEKQENVARISLISQPAEGLDSATINPAAKDLRSAGAGHVLPALQGPSP